MGVRDGGAEGAIPMIDPSGRSSPTDWMLLGTAPEWFAEPGSLPPPEAGWIRAFVPGTVAQALHAAGEWDFDRPIDFDAQDYWYRCAWRQDSPSAMTRHELRFAGLATFADVWLNGERILQADNMFREYVVDVTRHLAADNELVICFRALASALAIRRPRPRWKTRVVSQQQLRWIRTTLLGRIPGWTPPVAPVGPWRSVSLSRVEPASIQDVDVRPSLEGTTGVVHVTWRMPGPLPPGATATVTVGDVSTDLTIRPADDPEDGYSVSGLTRIEGVAPWWPHTHGAPALYPCVLRVLDGTRVLAEHPCDALGFASIQADTTDEGFGLIVNGLPVFCRGACWTVQDLLSLQGSEDSLRQTLTIVRDAGANMIRVGGTMTYESDAFYRLCDELGLLVWQDFMFANMDYPADDRAFFESVTSEAAYQLRRLSRHVSIALYCGNSEVEQQAAMLGMPRPLWRGALFDRLLPDLCASGDPRRPYVPSTPSGGTLPFHVGTGISHYYGVGAYLRPTEDVRRAQVRFTPECLGFSNVPDPGVVAEVFGGDLPAMHDPRWKRRLPRDTGPGWDFEDVRDHYLARMFSVDAVRLRSADTAKYLDLSRVTTGELMARVFAEWRGTSSTCQGALVWFLKDFWPGAGWGVLDSHAWPKPCFYYLRRAWQPQAVLITDEGLDGLRLHVVNDRDRPLRGYVELQLIRDGATIVAETRTVCTVPAHGRMSHPADALLDRFHDVSYAYRFGPPQYDVACAALVDDAGETLSEAFWFPQPHEVARLRDAAVVVDGRLQGSAVQLTMRSDQFLYAVHVDAPGYLPDDNYFCLAPHRTKVVRFQALAADPPRFRASIEAFNVDRSISVDVMQPPRTVAV